MSELKPLSETPLGKKFESLSKGIQTQVMPALVKKLAGYADMIVGMTTAVIPQLEDGSNAQKECIKSLETMKVYAKRLRETSGSTPEQLMELVNDFKKLVPAPVPEKTNEPSREAVEGSSNG